jgi:2-polyprenyl-3-methyl-5-hydroxy-6-metoxy-1,4-benzoquinol methylase
LSEDSQLLELQETLYNSSNPTRRWLHCSRRDWVVARLYAHSQSCAQALEVGPGSGIYLPILAQLAAQVTAADIESSYLAKAQQLQQTHRNLQCVIDDITASTLPRQSFNLVLCSEVIEHIADSGPALRGLHSLLQADGILVLSTPQRYSPLELCAKIAFLPGIIGLVRWIYGEAIMPTGHINLLTETALKKQLAEAGLDIIEQHKSGFYLPLIAEFGGTWGQRLLAGCEKALHGSWLDGLLWTQYYVLRRA